jgi:hypothetical protein
MYARRGNLPIHIQSSTAGIPPSIGDARGRDGQHQDK